MLQFIRALNSFKSCIRASELQSLRALHSFKISARASELQCIRALELQSIRASNLLKLCIRALELQSIRASNLVKSCIRALELQSIRASNLVKLFFRALELQSIRASNSFKICIRALELQSIRASNLVKLCIRALELQSIRASNLVKLCIRALELQSIRASNLVKLCIRALELQSIRASNLVKSCIRALELQSIRASFPIFSLILILIFNRCMIDKKTTVFQKVQEIKSPKAEKKEHIHEIHNDRRIDNYHWMRLTDEQKNDTTQDEQTKKVIDYLNAENKYREELTSHMKVQEDKLFEEIKGRIKQTDMSVPYRDNGYYYVTRFEEGKEYAIYSRHKESIEKPEEIMLNVNQLAEGHEYYAIGGMSVSMNNKVLAYSVDTVSRRQYSVHFKNLESGENYGDVIPNTSGNVVWANDNMHVFYSVKDAALRDYKILRHKLGTDVKEDVLVYHEKDETFSTYIYKTKSKKFLVIGSSATLSDEFRILDADHPTDQFKLFQPRIYKLEHSIAHYNDHWYILCNKDGAHNFKVMKCPEDKTQVESWEDFIAHDNEIFISDISLFNDYMVLEIRKDGISQIEIRPWKDSSFIVPFKEESFYAYLTVNPEFNTELIRLNYTSLTTPSTTYDFNVRTKEFNLLKQQEVVGTFKSSDYTTERRMVKANDGTMVPLSIVYRNGFEKNATHPCLLYGYGSYGISEDPEFSSARLSLLDRGFVFAIAHIRGGQEMGRMWYEHGKFFEKKNSFTDFINCGEWLVANKYCNPKKLYAKGGSAGGLLMGAVVNMRPDLWGGVLAGVPFVDVVSTMLDETIPLTTGEFDEWGNPKIKEYYDYMKSYSPYDNVEKKAYPPILITTGYHDSQVQYWEPAKWIAKLRAYKTDNNPLMMYCNMDTGHGGSSGRFRRLREVAMEYSFLLELAD